MDVILKPQLLDTYRKSGLEPQYVTTRQPNKACIYVDSQDSVAGTDIVSMIASTIRIAGENPSTLAYGVTRISINSFGIRFCIPNVNQRNNTITFYSSNSASLHTVVVPEGFYRGGTSHETEDLIDAVVVALNTATGASGLTFSKTVITGSPGSYNLNSAGGNYHFSLDCSAIIKGYQLWNLPRSQIPTNTKIVGVMSLYYTKYVDVCSTILTKYVKVRTATTSRTSNVVIRCHLSENDVFDKIVFINESSAPDIQFYFNPGEPINTIDFELRDQFGDLLYVPRDPDGNYRGFWWNIGLIIEC